MFQKFKNKKIVRIVSIVLVGLLLVGALSAVLLLKPKDTKKINSNDFVVGKIDSKGNFAESDDELCTKNFIACDGLEINPDFTANSKFQVFFYDVDKNFVKSTDVLDCKFNYIDNAPYVEYCKIMILPDMKGKATTEFSIKPWNKSSYLNDFKITVNKTQEYSAYNNYFKTENIIENKKYLLENWETMLGTGFISDSEYKSVEFSIPHNMGKIYFLHDCLMENSESYVYLMNGDKVVHYKTISNYANKVGVNGFSFYQYELDIRKLESTVTLSINRIIISVKEDINCYLYSDIELR